MYPLSAPFFPLRRWLSLRKRFKQSPRSVRPCLEQLEDRITPTGPTITTLASFTGSNGIQPGGGLVMDGNGNVYGASVETVLGGGFVYKLAKGSSGIGILAPIPTSDGLPVGTLVMDSNNNLYGTTKSAITGIAGGIVYELPQGSSTIKVLATFDGKNGLTSNAGLVMDKSGDLFGTTVDGTIFEVAKGSGTITTLATFSNIDERSEGGLTIDSSGNLYGTTPVGGSSWGTVFELAKGSSTITTLASFDHANGALPEAGVMMDSIGNLYGTAVQGGTNDDGTVFEVAKGSGTITALASFNGGSNGAFPASRLVTNISGDLIGTTEASAFPSSDGSVFELANHSSSIYTVADFNGGNGNGPDGYPIEDSSGNLYGTTVGGGTDNFGTIYGVQAVAPSSHLVFLKQPGNTAAGETLSPVTVAIEDQFGDIETGDNTVQITLAIGPNSPSETLNGTTTLTVSDGEATFNDLSIDQLGAGYTLGATTNVGGIPGALSSDFDITTGKPAQLAFLQGPTSTVAGANLTPAVNVAIEDRFGNIETQDNTDQISLQLSPSGKLNGTLTKTVSGGEASFGDLSINQAANGYALVANTFISGIKSLPSSNFNIAPANVTSTAANTTVPFSASTQTETLFATVANSSAPKNPVNEGTVTFTVKSGQTVVGTPVQGTVSDGKASAGFSVPAGLALGSYTIAVAYNDSQGNFLDSGDTTGTLTVSLLPVVTTNPSNQMVSLGGTATFTAAANGNPTPTVQWQISTDGGTTFTNISGATSTTLTLTNVQPSQNGDEYQAVFTNSNGTGTSSAATLQLIPTAPTVTVNPSDRTVTSGLNATFTASANGYPTPTVQWQVSTDGGQTFTNLSGATSNTLTLIGATLAMNGYKYQAVFTNSAGSIASSVATVSVTLSTVPIITSNPTNQGAPGGASVTFTASASGPPTPTVQWQVSTDGGLSFGNISGATGNALTVTNVTPSMSGYEYRAVFTNADGTTMGIAATLTVTTSSSPSQGLSVPPVLALLGELFNAIVTVNANGTETIVYSLFGMPLLVATYDSSGHFVSASMFGVNVPNWVWFV